MYQLISKLPQSSNRKESLCVFALESRIHLIGIQQVENKNINQHKNTPDSVLPRLKERFLMDTLLP